MSNPLNATYYAERAIQQTVSVIENVPVARDTFRLRFDCPQMARRILPGQFLMMRLTDRDDPLLARPLALYDSVLSPRGQPAGIDVVYLVVGKCTRLLAKVTPGQQLVVWGPLGNGFEPRAIDHLIMVAGGIGQTPFFALGQEYLGKRRYGDPPRTVPSCSKVTLCYGARTREYLAGVEDFQRVGVDVRISTEDGSCGHRGLVTDLLKDILAHADTPHRIVCCGPEPMMEAVSAIAIAAGVPCQVSLETPMACGIGICFTCVAKIRDGEGKWDYRRTCVEGPVFDATEVVW